MDRSFFEGRTVKFVSTSHFLVTRTEVESIANAGRTVLKGSQSHATAHIGAESTAAEHLHTRLGEGFSEGSEKICEVSMISVDQ
jgi:hypothetical protein